MWLFELFSCEWELIIINQQKAMVNQARKSVEGKRTQNVLICWSALPKTLVKSEREKKLMNINNIINK